MQDNKRLKQDSTNLQGQLATLHEELRMSQQLQGQHLTKLNVLAGKYKELQHEHQQLQLHCQQLQQHGQQFIPCAHRLRPSEEIRCHDSGAGHDHGDNDVDDHNEEIRRNGPGSNYTDAGGGYSGHAAAVLCDRAPGNRSPSSTNRGEP